MGKCSTCSHYSYKAGIATSLQMAMGISGNPTRPTNYCDHAKFAWVRTSGEVKKPRGIPCKYELAEMYCDKCGKRLKRHSDCWLKLDKEKYICQNCKGG